MKFIILSDIHSNIYALEKCFDFIENMNFDAIIWCGDYITDVPKAHETIEKIKDYSQKYPSYLVRGNREDYVLEYADGQHPDWKIDGFFSDIVNTYSQLTKEDIDWLKGLKETLEIMLHNGEKILVSHKYREEINHNYQYKIWGHEHKQYNYYEKNIRFINPGSVGQPLNRKMGAQFSVLEITDSFKKLEEYHIEYDITKTIQAIKAGKTYNNSDKWGNITIKLLQTGKNYAKMCVDEYNKIRKENSIEYPSLEIWHMALNKLGIE